MEIPCLFIATLQGFGCEDFFFFYWSPAHFSTLDRHLQTSRVYFSMNNSIENLSGKTKCNLTCPANSLAAFERGKINGDEKKPFYSDDGGRNHRTLGEKIPGQFRFLLTRQSSTGLNYQAERTVRKWFLKSFESPRRQDNSGKFQYNNSFSMNLRKTGEESERRRKKITLWEGRDRLGSRTFSF